MRGVCKAISEYSVKLLPDFSIRDKSLCKYTKHQKNLGTVRMQSCNGTSLRRAAKAVSEKLRKLKNFCYGQKNRIVVSCRKYDYCGKWLMADGEQSKEKNYENDTQNAKDTSICILRDFAVHDDSWWKIDLY